jgi:hypothetical protein
VYHLGDCRVVGRWALLLFLGGGRFLVLAFSDPIKNSRLFRKIVVCLFLFLPRPPFHDMWSLCKFSVPQVLGSQGGRGRNSAGPSPPPILPLQSGREPSRTAQWGSLTAMALTCDHRPDDKQEKRRIVNAGGDNLQPLFPFAHRCATLFLLFFSRSRWPDKHWLRWRRRLSRPRVWSAVRRRQHRPSQSVAAEHGRSWPRAEQKLGGHHRRLFRWGQHSA